MFGDQSRQRTPFDIRRYNERLEAQGSWPFLTTRDLDAIHSEQDLCDIVTRRTRGTPADVAAVVRHWMTDYFHRLGTS